MVQDDGTLEWFQHGELHRERGPARLYTNGRQEWWWRNELHRPDGPAVTDKDGEIYWWWKNAEIINPDRIREWRPYLTRYGLEPRVGL